MLVAAAKPTTPVKGAPVAFCPVCGAPSTPVDASQAQLLSSADKCASCGFNLALAAPETPLVRGTTPARVPGFAYLMLGIQCAASLVLAWTLFYLGSPLTMMPRQFLGVLAVLSVIGMGGSCLWLRTRSAISWARRVLFTLGLVTVPLGVCAMAAAVSVAGAQRYCAICSKRISWSEHASSCPHCLTSFHRYGECRQARRQLLVKAWGREPSGEEVGDTCPICFRSLQQGLTGGKPE